MAKGIITLLNTSILTSYGNYQYEPLTLDEAVKLFNCPSCSGGMFPCQTCGDGGKLVHTANSAIGHQATADVLSSLLGFEIKPNRIEYKQDVDDVALVFKLKTRVEEGRVLNSKEIEEIGYEFGLLTRKK